MSQLMGGSIIQKALRTEMNRLETELKGFISSCQIGERIVCPFCKYQSKHNKGTAKVFPDNTFKCFSCGVWRRL